MRFVSRQSEAFSPEGIHANKIRFYVDNDNNWAVCHTDGIYLYNLNLQTWTNHPGIPSSKRDAAWLNGDSILVAVGDQNLSTDGIYTLNAVTGHYAEVLGFKSPNFIEYDNLLGRFFIGGSNGFAYSEDGNLWYIYPEFTQKDIVDMSIYGSHYVISQFDTINNIYTSNDGGSSWETITGGPILSDLHFDSFGKLYGVFPDESWSSGLWSSNDYGATWDVEFWATGINCVGTDPMGNVFVGFGDAQPPYAGIARWDSLNQELHFMNEGLPNLKINQITINLAMSAIVLFCCTESGVYINSNYVGIDVPEETSARLQLWPNPAQDQLNIRHELNGEIKAFIYSNNGRLVASFSDPGSSEEIHYNCSKLEQGTYLIILDNGEERKSKKWVKL